MARTLVKVCGLTRVEDVRVAVEAGADWVGFVLNGDSPRRIAPEAAATLRAVANGVATVGVMVSPVPDDALALARAAGCDRLQLHRVDPAQWPDDFPLPVTFAIGLHDDGRLSATLPHARHLVLLDAVHAALAGGTGQRIRWDAAGRLAGVRDVILAGGLDDTCVAEAIEQVRPLGVDASSRLESAPGIKDPARVRAFVRAVREIDDRLAGRA